MTLVTAGVTFANEYIVSTWQDNTVIDSAKWLTPGMAALYIVTRRADRVVLFGMAHQPMQDLATALNTKNVPFLP
jgi:hypothetical protein